LLRNADYAAHHYVVFFQFPVTSSLLCAYTLFSNFLSLCSSYFVRVQILEPYKTTDKIIFRCILSFIFLIANWKTKDSALNDTKLHPSSICSKFLHEFIFVLCHSLKFKICTLSNNYHLSWCYDFCLYSVHEAWIHT